MHARAPTCTCAQVGFSRDGMVKAVDMRLFSAAGNSMDLSGPVMDRAILHSDNCYTVPHMRLVGKLCKTNQSSNTAYRGFGGPQVWAGVCVGVCGATISNN
eukprot:18727-Chlamydomonas_euryale.AAC.1